jgi:hypothetical protein
MKYAILLFACLSSVSCEPMPHSQGNEWKDFTPADKSRISVVEIRYANSRALTILKDDKTGTEYLSFDHGLVRLDTPASK